MGKSLPRALAARLREYVGNRRARPRRVARFGASVAASVSVLEPGAGEEAGTSTGPSVAGETCDLSATGLTLRVRHVRVGGHYLTDPGHHLGVRLELPSGEAFLLARPVRFEQEEGDGGEGGYLLGLRIVRMGEADRALYAGFLGGLAPTDRRRDERRRARPDLAALTAGGTWAVPEALTPAEISAAFERFVAGGRRPRPG